MSDELKALVGMTDAELLHCCRVRIELAHGGGRLEHDMAYAAQEACRQTDRVDIWVRARDEFTARRREQRLRIAKGA